MNKYQEALDKVKNSGYYDFESDIDHPTFEEDDKNIALLQELIDKHKPSRHYTKQQLIDELDKVYTIAKGYEDDLIHYVDIYRLIERLVEDE